MVQYQHIFNGINSNSYGIERKQTGSWVMIEMLKILTYSINQQVALGLQMLKSKSLGFSEHFPISDL